MYSDLKSATRGGSDEISKKLTRGGSDDSKILQEGVSSNTDRRVSKEMHAPLILPIVWDMGPLE